ncbi:hypothetical protein PIB30_033222 [Stylosanthes scabra]|uniref:Uncharacterized protein n=1 Tax=Stylosanthes scabra TaxID=79078 RepID=A0ABU6UC92_9FABA|nr:hypothetical protein [Stylosanthes scabra]
MCNRIITQQDMMNKEIVDMKKWQIQETVGKFKTTHMNKAHQQLNPNLVELPVTKVTKLIYENCDKKRPVFYGCLKSDLDAGSSSQAAPPTTPSTAPPSVPASEHDQADYYPEQFFQD